ncbi:MAG: glycosyltransferase family 4 protein, partial [SAR324 cluster bacterium]|nr:glycosyltransferase family 4 protein [SAR324 cluster bacterium]
MKLLILAPEPFFRERGTPIAVRLVAETLGLRYKNDVELLCYGEGERVEISNVLIRRTWTPAFLNNIHPGISIKKIILDLLMFFNFLRLLFKHRQNQYTLIHAVEESVFFALIVKVFFGLPYIYDMDSRLSTQLMCRWPWLKPFGTILTLMESLAIRNSLATIAVCKTLFDEAQSMGAKEIFLLSDVSLLETEGATREHISLKERCGIVRDTPLVLYVGNLEPYQGISLLLEAFKSCVDRGASAHLAIIGGRKDHIKEYENKCIEIGIKQYVHFLGPKPLSSLGAFLSQADVLVSPRTSGNNTPMKIYSYLHAGKALVATSLETHTQVLNSEISKLVEATPDAFGQALFEVLSDAKLRSSLGEKARIFAEAHYTLPVFKKSLNSIYE